MALGHVARQGQAREVGARGRGQLRRPVHRERVRQAHPQPQLLAGGKKTPRLLGWGGPWQDERPRVCWPVAVEGGGRRARVGVGGLGEESTVVGAGVGAHHWEVLGQGLGQSRICQNGKCTWVHWEISGAIVADDLASRLLVLDVGGCMKYAAEGVLGIRSQSVFVGHFCWCDLLVQAAHPCSLDEFIPSLLRCHKVNCPLRVSNCFGCKSTLHLSYRRLAVSEKELLHGFF